MVGVTKKEVSQMTKYYLKMDNIMKNMFVVALNDELQAQSEQDECLEETKALLKKVSEYENINIDELVSLVADYSRGTKADP